MRGVTEISNDGSIDRILVFNTRRICSKEHNVVSRERTISTDGSLVDGELVGGKNTSLSLIRTKNSDSG